MVECLELLESMHVLRADGALPDRAGSRHQQLVPSYSPGGAGSRHQQLLVVGLADELVERVEAAVLAYQVTCLTLLRTLQRNRLYVFFHVFMFCVGVLIVRLCFIH